MNRRGFLKAILASGVAPYVVTSAGVLMPLRALAVPTWGARFVAINENLLRTTVSIEELVKSDLAATLAQYDRSWIGEGLPIPIAHNH